MKIHFQLKSDEFNKELEDKYYGDDFNEFGVFVIIDFPYQPQKGDFIAPTLLPTDVSGYSFHVSEDKFGVEWHKDGKGRAYPIIDLIGIKL